MRNTIITTACLALLYSGTAISDSKIGRYTTSDSGATFVQQNLLATEVKIDFPSQVETIKQAMDLLLARSGYRLSEIDLDPHINYLFDQPLPDVHRHVGPMTLREALQTLAGQVWVLDINPLARTVSFHLSDEQYRKLAHGGVKNKPVLFFEANNASWGCDKPHPIHHKLPIYFAPNSFRLDYRDHQKIDLLIKKAKAEDLGIVIKSYTDPSGPTEMHVTMSKARGDAIVAYLKEQGAGSKVVANEALGATHPDLDQPYSLQRVSEISLVSNECTVHVPLWAVEADSTLEETIFKWVSQSESYKNLVYEVRNQAGFKVNVILNSELVFEGSIQDAMRELIRNLRTRPEITSMKATFYQGDKTILLEGVVNTEFGGKK
ncbi:OmpA family protein [Thiomicrospira sp.]|uniref:PFGI-1 class ICE element type IV pilus protein PilL2 n=1 Tax=Thiomicrospira sp. TaxID=935 RepID=UPI002F94BE15